MKKKKKLAILISFLMVMCFAFAACGGSSDVDLSDSEYVGEWICESVSVADESSGLDGGTWTLTLNGDGTGTFVSVDNEGTEETSDITWELTDDGFKTKGDTKLTFTKEDSGIKTTLLGVELHFVRPGEVGPDDGAPDAGAKYGYMGQDPVELAVWKYLCEDIASQYGSAGEEGVVAVPVVQIIKTEEGDDGDTHVYGNFHVYNYRIDGDTLVMVSGGTHPGMMHVAKDGDEYKVTAFDQVKDGGEFDASAKEIFGDSYDDFMKVYSDDEAREALRLKGLADYVKTNGLSVTKTQEEGWDAVDLDL